MFFTCISRCICACICACIFSLMIPDIGEGALGAAGSEHTLATPTVHHLEVPGTMDSVGYWWIFVRIEGYWWMFMHIGGYSWIYARASDAMYREVLNPAVSFLQPIAALTKSYLTSNWHEITSVLYFGVDSAQKQISGDELVNDKEH